MADQTYNLTQTGAEVQAIINDANGVKGAGATTSLTTDYIMLKDTSGAYHKIQKSSFTEAVRNTLASLLVNNDKGTTISQIAAIDSGDFGSVTPANLASVLGGVATEKKIEMIQITDMNDFVPSSSEKYRIAWINYGSVIQNLPSNYSGSNTRIYAEVITVSNTYSIQKIYLADGTFYVRAKSSSTWGGWNQFYDTSILTNSALLSPLASALGGVPLVATTDMTSETLDSETPGGYRVSTDLSPFGCAGIIYVLKRNNMFSQVFISTVVADWVIGLRSKSKSGDAWSSWKKCTMTAI